MDKYIPVSELYGYEDDRIVWRVQLPPYAPAENVGINIGRLGKLARLGGLESLRVATFDGETTKVTPGISSVDERGNATASMAASETKASIQESSLDSFEDAEIPYDYVWQRGTISINSAELDYRVGEKGKLKDPKVWSRELDKALRHGVRANARKSLIEKPSLFEKLKAPMALGVFATMDIAIDHKWGMSELTSELRGLELYQFLAIPLLYRLQKLPKAERGRKISLIPGLALDRYLMVDGISSALPLVRQIK